MTRRRGHDAVLRSLNAALENKGLKSVKVNVVVIKDLNDREVLDFVGMTRNQDLSIRFIEFMPFTGTTPAALHPTLSLTVFIREQVG